ncbi:hypothetical protein VUR80DRAFT_10128 [Thermomyces stellatus]
MVRKAVSEGRSLFCEWAVGSSIDSAMRRLERERLEREKEEAQSNGGVIKLELTTDDDSKVDSVRVTYPRHGSKGTPKGATKASSGVKQVRFDQRPLKPALKKKKSRKEGAYGSSGSDTLASETESSTDTTRSVDASTSEPSDSEATSTDKSSSRRRKSRKSRQAKSESSGDSDAVYDSNCSDCERDRAKMRAKERKSRRKYSSDPESSTSEKVRHSKKDERRSRKEPRTGSHRDAPIDMDSGSGTSNHGDKRSHRARESRKRQSRGESLKDKDHTSSGDRKSATSPKQRPHPEAMPGPHPRRPNLVRPIRAEVMQVEHTVEGPEDPRPNAFVDEHNNIVRVYHGPAYGNPFGRLYPRRDPSLQPLPVGVPHPLDNPYYYGFRNCRYQDHSHSPTGHMTTTLSDPYSSIRENAPIHSGRGPAQHDHGTKNLTTGLWGIDSGPFDATKEKTSPWSNNVGPPQPSASLRQANSNSRWNFKSSKKGSRKEDEAGVNKHGWHKTRNDSWGDAGNNDHNAGDTGGWSATGGDKTGERAANVGDGDRNEGSAGQDWYQGNDNTAGGDDTWESGNQGGYTWNDKAESGDAWDNQSTSNWKGRDQNNDTSWNDTRGYDNNWSPDNAGGNWVTNGKDTSAWDGGTDNASNNVGPPGKPSCDDPPGSQDWSPSKHHVPGAWDGTGPERHQPWSDPTAAQSTRNQRTPW